MSDNPIMGRNSSLIKQELEENWESMNITNEERIIVKRKMTSKEIEQVKAKLKELFRNEVSLVDNTLYFCDNHYLIEPYILSILTKFKLFIQPSLI